MFAGLREPSFEAIGGTEVFLHADVYLEGLDFVPDGRDDVFFGGVASSSGFACTVWDRIALVFTGISTLGEGFQDVQ